MQTGIIILIVAVAAIVAGIVFMLVTNLKRRYPGGDRYTLKSKHGYKVHVIFSNGVTQNSVMRESIAEHALDAVSASGLAWQEVALTGRLFTDDTSQIKETIVLFKTKKGMTAKASQLGYKYLAGFIDQYEARRWGKRLLPMAVINEGNIEEAAISGEPIIHEMMHALEKDFIAGPDDHHNPGVWKATNKSGTSAQQKAGDMYRYLRANPNQR